MKTDTPPTTTDPLVKRFDPSPDAPNVPPSGIQTPAQIAMWSGLGEAMDEARIPAKAYPPFTVEVDWVYEKLGFVRCSKAAFVVPAALGVFDIDP